MRYLRLTNEIIRRWKFYRFKHEQMRELIQRAKFLRRRLALPFFQVSPKRKLRARAETVLKEAFGAKTVASKLYSPSVKPIVSRRVTIHVGSGATGSGTPRYRVVSTPSSLDVRCTCAIRQFVTLLVSNATDDHSR